MKSHVVNTCVNTSVNTSVNKKVALDLRVHSRAIENRIARTIHLHLRNRKWIANNVLREVLDVLTLMRRDAPTLGVSTNRAPDQTKQEPNNIARKLAVS